MLTKLWPQSQRVRAACAQAALWMVAIVTAWAGVWWLFTTALQGVLPAAAVWLFWAVAKLCVWILPLWLWAVRVGPRDRGLDVAGLGNGLQLMRAALGVALWFGLSVMAARLEGTEPAPGALDWLAWRTVLLSPLLEELLVHGLLFTFLIERGVSVAATTALTSAGFLLLHLPGWSFMGDLSDKLGLAARIALLGVYLGWLTGRTRSLWPAYAVHVANNAYSSGTLTGLLEALGKV